MKVNSEIIPLKKVLLHRPGEELNALTKENMQDYLFDELIDLNIAQKEHDYFAEILRKQDVEVVYLDDLMVDVLKNDNIKDSFIKDYLKEASCIDENIYTYFSNIKDLKQLVRQTMVGYKDKIIAMPNLYFTRDTFTIIDDSIALYPMHSYVRSREGIYGKYINSYHPDFHLNTLYERDFLEKIEGGDVLILDEKTLAIGVSERTSFDAALKLSKNVFIKTKINKVLAIHIPKKRACMHLDTVITKINNNDFICYGDYINSVKVTIITPEKIYESSTSLKQVLSDLLNINVKLIEINDSNAQWNDACNTLCISLNHLVVYDINEETNNKLINNGSTLYKIPSKELLKGRGGPHCMSMPLVRK